MIAQSLHMQYGKALHEIVMKSSASEQVLENLNSLAQISRDQNFLELMRKIASLPKETIKKILAKVFDGEVNNSVLNLLVLLTIKKHFQQIPKIFESYKKIYFRDKNILEISVHVAKKLQQDEENHLIQELQKRTDQKISVNFQENPALIGGVQFYERGHVTDYSIKNYLENLRKYLLATQQ